MPLIGGEQILNTAYTFRNIWIRGRYGGGKTYLAFLIAKHLQASFGYGVFSNIDHSLGEPYLATQQDIDTPGLYPSDIQVGQMVHNVVIYDEAWLTLGQGTSPKEIKKYLAFLRKRDFILLMPSVLPIAKGAWFIWVERVLNLGIVGLPIWVYEWGIAGQSAKKSGGKFAVIYPQRDFGLYDTLSQPDELGGLFNEYSD